MKWISHCASPVADINRDNKISIQVMNVILEEKSMCLPG